MSGLTPELDARIAEILRTKGKATVYAIPGLDEVDAAEALAAYAEAHASEGVTLDRGVLTAPGSPAPPPLPPRTSPDLPAGPLPPGPGPEGAALFPEPAEHAATGRPYEPPSGGSVSGWLWLLPLLFGILGGVVAWAIAKDKDPAQARRFIIVGVAIALIGGCIGARVGVQTADRLAQSRATDTAWPPSQSGRAAFYYFGTPT